MFRQSVLLILLISIPCYFAASFGFNGIPGILESSSATTLKVGDRVVRGQDWKWNNHGRGTAGTVKAISAFPGWYNVLWDNGDYFNYRFGANGKFDLELATKEDLLQASPPSPTQSTSGRAPPRNLEVGDFVVRGSDWAMNNQDGPTVGVVVSIVPNYPEWVAVSWYGQGGTHNTYRYRYGFQGKFDIIHATQEEIDASNIVTILRQRVLKAGDKVVRGPNWRRGNEDVGKIGTVLGPLGRRVNEAYVVQWADGSTHSYSYGPKFGKDIILAAQEDLANTSTTSATSTLRNYSQNIRLKVGQRVIRLSDWKPELQLQDQRKIGTVIRAASLPDWYKIMWADRIQGYHHYGNSSDCDVVLINNSDLETSASTHPVHALNVRDFVVRGPDWIYGNEDCASVGTVLLAVPVNYCYYIEWANGFSEIYYYGKDGIYEIQKATKQDIRTAVCNTSQDSFEHMKPLKIGDVVIAGQDADRRQKDCGKHGVVIDPSRSAGTRPKVLCAYGNVTEFSYGGAENRYEIIPATSEDLYRVDPDEYILTYIEPPTFDLDPAVFAAIKRIRVQGHLMDIYYFEHEPASPAHGQEDSQAKAEKADQQQRFLFDNSVVSRTNTIQEDNSSEGM